MTSVDVVCRDDRRDQVDLVTAAWDAGRATWVVDPASSPRRLEAMCEGVLAPGEVERLVAQGHVTCDLDLPEDTAVVVPTSGTTGRPRLVVLTAAALDASAAGAHAHLGIGAGDRWLLALPLHHVAGLSVLWRSRVLGVEPVVQERLDVTEANTAGATIAALVPTQLRRLVDAGQRLAARVLLGGAAISPALLAASAAGGHVGGVVRSYGLTETCGGCVYDGIPFADVEVATRAGRLALRGPVLAAGTLAPTGLEPLTGPDGWLVTNDLGEVAPDGMVSVAGRVDDVIITGGVNVSAARVEVVLADHPAVAAAGVVGLPDPEWGEVVTAAVVLAPGQSLPESELRAMVATNCGQAAVPRRFVVVDDLPTTSLGKIARPDLKARLRS